MLIRVGTVGRAHGIRGELKVVPDTDDPGRVSSVKSLHVGRDAATAMEHEVASFRMQASARGDAMLIGLVGVDDRTAAESLRGAGVYAREEDLPPLDDGEWFVDDLTGLRVVLEDGVEVGSVADVLDTPAHPVLVVARAGQPDVLIPAVTAFLRSVDFDANEICVSPIEGLLEPGA